MRALKVDLSEIMESMYKHYNDVTSSLPAFPERAILESILQFLHACEQALKSPRALRDLFAA